ncbi:Carboxymethylenebutenolidase [Thermobaculum terrenum ATCC BAA-798]|uniref:Carboxymethylenebutenolidase n=1 Tax=Thermobaculum terrenum (strain ATCC BAA-798 / CCMEE 7001 / YNP1) TaxID=525904 RepID=D1CE64_THET1|nr:dienelactone hydrolase family protein [Thermobaculum terrenum]ACZ41220.1 Carboxymethylenebutenolidase [Thermobaculum terrenum ATCC BAA-798]
MGEMVTFPSNGTTAEGYLAKPDTDKAPGVLVIQEWWGLNDNIKSICERFASEGFLALAPDLYHGRATTEPDEARKLAMSLQMETAAKDMSGAVDYLREHAGYTSVGAVGYCMGGGLALFIAALRGDVVKAVVPFYGLVPPSAPPVDWSKLQASVLGHYAELDQGITVERVREFENQLKSLGKEVEIHIYQGAQHGFCNDTRPQVYNREACELAWQRTIAFLRKKLVS